MISKYLRGYVRDYLQHYANLRLGRNLKQEELMDFFADYEVEIDRVTKKAKRDIYKIIQGAVNDIEDSNNRPLR